jgi:hypothetical protein
MRSAKRAVAEVMRDLSRVVSGWPRELLIETRVAEMTPVSSVYYHISICPEIELKEHTAKQQATNASRKCKKPDKNPWVPKVLLEEQRHIAEIDILAFFLVVVAH